MVEIILQILSIIGIILLVLVGVIILVVCLVLFVPIRYNIFGKNEDEIYVRAKFHWLFHSVTAVILYETQLQRIIKVFGITVYDSLKEKKLSHKKKKSKKSKISPEQKTEEKTEEKKEPVSHKTIEKVSEPNIDEEKVKYEKQVKKEHFFTRLKNKILGFYKKVRYTITNIYDIICNIKDNLDYYISVFQEEQTIQLFNLTKNKLGKIFKKLAPNKIKGDVLFGTGEPDTTGYILAAVSIMKSYLGNDIIINVDFEQKVYKGYIILIGKMRIITLLTNIIPIMKDKNLKPVIKKLKREN